MEKIKVKVPAKINLALNILGKRDDEYHLVEMVMQTVSLYDTIEIRINNGENINLNSNIEIISDITKNTAYKASLEFFKYTNITNPGIIININKKIPIQSGLAGGSADAAGIIIGLNEILKTNLKRKDLIEIGKKIGADVPFCIIGSTMISRGIGTELKELKEMPKCYFVISKPKEGISTKKAYEKFDSSNYFKFMNMNIHDLVEAIDAGNLNDISLKIFNSFEKICNLSEVEKIKELMKKLGALNSCMSGSGSAVFGIFSKIDVAEKCCFEIKKLYKDTFLCTPVCGPIIEI